jgi:hypothetical protein
MDGRDCRVGWRLVSHPFLVKTIRWPSLAYPFICRMLLLMLANPVVVFFLMPSSHACIDQCRAAVAKLKWIASN